MTHPTHANPPFRPLPRPVAALFTSRKSAYRNMPGVTAFDRHTDARSFDLLSPVVAHPPCRTWSKYLRHQARPDDREEEQALAFFSVMVVRLCGGVLEQPAGSMLWLAANLPCPGKSDRYGFGQYIEQGWFGFPTRKPTWLYICGVPMDQVHVPAFALQCQSPRASGKPPLSQTTPALARWLVDIARKARL